MLGHMRSKQKSLLIKVAFVVIILSFVIGYAMMTSPGGSGSDSTDLAMTVNGQPVSYSAYQDIYGNLYRFYQNIYKEQFTPALEEQLDLRRQARDLLLEEILLLQEAQRLDLQVTENELVGRIASVPAFQENGVFSKERYLQVLAYQRMTTDDFELLQTRELLVEKVRERLEAGVTVSEADIEKEFRSRYEKIKLAFLRMTPALFEDKVEVTDAKLESFFAERREDFRLPEKVALRYLQFEPARYEDEVTFSEEEIERYYRRHLIEFDIPEQVEAAHVLIKLAENADEATRQEKRELAEKVLEQARSGADFAALARKYSDDQGSAKQGGDLGYFERGAMVAPFEQAAFALQPGDISDIVETDFGLHVIKVTGYIEAGVKPLSEVIEPVKAALRQNKARELAMEKAMDAYNINRKSGDLDAAATANNLGIKETGFFARDGVIDGIGRSAEISALAFALDEGQLARPTLLPGKGVFLITLKERQPSRLPELNEVRAKVELAFRAARSVELAKAAATAALEQAKDGTPLGRLTGKYPTELEQTDLFSRSFGNFVPKLGNAEELVEDAFALPDGTDVAPQVYEVDGAFVVAKRTEHIPADMELLAAERDEISQAVRARKEEEAVAQHIKQLKESAEIVEAPQLKNFLKEG